jgi:ubiquinone/menaquinone biosynthesis methyltransferase
MGRLPDIHQRDPGSGRVRDPRAHAAAVRGMFGRISGVYDLMNHVLSANLDRRWRARVAATLDPGTGRLLDLCAGTGDLGLACLRAGRAGEVVAVDFVPAMLAGLRGKRASDRVQPVAGDGLRLPLPDESVDAVVAGFGVRNLADPAAGAREMWRVLRPCGQVLVLEFFAPDPAARGERRGAPAPVRWLLDRVVPLGGRLLARDRDAYAYLTGSMDRFLTVAQYHRVLAAAGFAEPTTARLTLGVAHVVGARKPGGG